MIIIDILKEPETPIDPGSLERAANLALAYLSAPKSASVTIVITDDPHIQELNHQYREIDAPTDVLAFPAGYLDPETNEIYLGDIIISYPQAASQADQGRHPVEDELQLLVVHGTLHLLGHDHADADEKARMWADQGAILDQLGISFQDLDEA